MQSRYFSINTDLASYREYHRGAEPDNPFAFWLRDGYAYLTPTPKNAEKRAKTLSGMRPGDVVFAYESKTRRGYIATGVVQELWDQQLHNGRPELFRDAEEGFYRIRVSWDSTFSCSYADLKQAGLRQYLDTLVPVNDPRVGQLLRSRLGQNAGWEEREIHEQKRVEDILADDALTVTEKKQLVDARRGQGQFRCNVLQVEPRCRLTLIAHQGMLRASHIKPWRHATNRERLDGNNGLMLAPHVDHLFDDGWITFDDSGRLIISIHLPHDVLQAWHLTRDASTGVFNETQIGYLRHHRQHVFRR
ncbi:hypothetical protein WL88_11940 [Burkholderia diffusa]|uniref:HNH nuclease domain-containing protein n=1 Tax=Burkholderia diffusa TaxID=488732 RepID=A0AAW3PJ67_9BURK|nr:HNH endonuclease [Burkholderia diffusa]KVC12499.1 hypothetical protein WI69_24880 [Burkholderia diffusa]KWF37332.1 hypothetical protein WL85_12340 [Burkholderia diffusa]KWF40496.1 hypothetical protein WL86_14905 [Burkholderia diffusa]KWF42689.1 hypothetical protein WL87_26520 [Burkholderia diffusa]KWF56239.1 hypothetical protein WL88_11940 [Burkholderia diffusa]